MAWAQSARELSENYTLTGQSELPPTILSTDPIQQNHSNLKGDRLLVGWHKRTDTKQFPVASLSKKWTCREKKVREVTRASRARPFVVIAKFLAGNLTHPCLTLANYLLGNISMKAYRGNPFISSWNYLFFLSSFLSIRVEKEREREGSVDDSFEIGILRNVTLPFFKSLQKDRLIFQK